MMNAPLLGDRLLHIMIELVLPDPDRLPIDSIQFLEPHPRTRERNANFVASAFSCAAGESDERPERREIPGRVVRC
jgi:hypothetical protein